MVQEIYIIDDTIDLTKMLNAMFEDSKEYKFLY